jgi:hypothetical protein
MKTAVALVVLLAMCSPALATQAVGNGTVADFTACTTWTPADLSGVSLPLTINSAYYCHTNSPDGSHTVTVFMDITYPTTVSGANAMVSLPFIPSGSLNAFAIGLNTQTLANLTVTSDSNTAQIFFWVGSTQKANVFLTGERVAMTGTYKCTL